MRRPVVALVYAGLMGWHFASYYLDVRSAPPDTIIDYNAATILFGPISLLAALVIARWWAVALPLTAFPFALAMLIAGEFDERYARVAEDRGGVVGVDWFGVAAALCYFGIPGALLGAGSAELVRRGRR